MFWGGLYAKGSSYVEVNIESLFLETPVIYERGDTDPPNDGLRHFVTLRMPVSLPYWCLMGSGGVNIGTCLYRACIESISGIL